MTLKEWQVELNRVSREHGWWDGDLAIITPTRVLSLMALIHSEISEAVECARKEDMELRFTEKGKPEGFGSELADAFIRICDVSEQMGIDLEEIVKIKNEYNKTRTYKHGGKSI